MTDVRVWVGCLAHYNNGDLIGAWLDASEAGEWKCPRYNPSDVYINCEETWIFDHEIPGVRGEMDPMTAVKWGEVFGVVPQYDADAFAAWLGHSDIDGPSDDLYLRFEDAYHGTWESPEAHASEMYESDGIESPTPAYFMLAFDLIAWDQDYTFVDGHVFSNHS